MLDELNLLVGLDTVKGRINDLKKMAICNQKKYIIPMLIFFTFRKGKNL